MQIIITKDGQETVFECPERASQPILPLMQGREWKRITVIGTAEAVRAAFVDGITYRQQWESAIIGDGGVQSTETQTRDLSDYCVAGDVVDTRDGIVTVYMGRRTPIELLQDELAAMDAAMQEGVNSVE